MYLHEYWCAVLMVPTVQMQRRAVGAPAQSLSQRRRRTTDQQPRDIVPLLTGSVMKPHPRIAAVLDLLEHSLVNQSGSGLWVIPIRVGACQEVAHCDPSILTQSYAALGN